jgi:hypothetical protein
MIKTILFYLGFLVFIALFSEEFARAVAWLQGRLAQVPRYRRLAYPIILALMVLAGILIAVSLIKFATSSTFSYD